MPNDTTGVRANPGEHPAVYIVPDQHVPAHILERRPRIPPRGAIDREILMYLSSTHQPVTFDEIVLAVAGEPSDIAFALGNLQGHDGRGALILCHDGDGVGVQDTYELWH